MSVRHAFFALALALLLPLEAAAQFLDYGSDAARLRWRIARLPHYDLVFPQGTDSMAKRYASFLEAVHPHVQKTIGKPRQARFPVVLHPGNMNSNGLVSWAPRRMELITTPSVTLGAQAWDKHLVLHESRHIFQTSKVMNGIFRPLYFLIGEQAAGVAAFFLPNWFLEGDAVSTETGLSNAGRGRLPEFNLVYRAQRMSGKPFYSLDKWELGSYADATGTFYALGYDLASYARQRYGADIWDKTTSRYVHNLLFEGSFKHFTGSSIKQLYHDTFDYLAREWQQQDSLPHTAAAVHSPRAATYTSYRYPQALNDSVIFAIKSGLRDLNALVALTHGREQHLAYLGTVNSSLHLRQHRLYWTEQTTGLRWAQQNHSLLRCYDLQTGRITTLGQRRRYLAPAIDQQGQTAAVSHPLASGKNQLTLIRLNDARELASFDVPANGFIKALTFAGNDTLIALTVDDGGTCLLRFQPRTGQWSELLRTRSANLTSPVWNQGKLYFESGANGTNNLYCMEPSTRQVHRLTAARFGAFDPAYHPASRRLIFADYQADGYRIASLSADSLLHEPADLNCPSPLPFAATLSAQEGYNLDTARLADPHPFFSQPYRKTLHTFKIHSWAPFYYDVTEAMNTSADNLSTIVKPGVMVLSQNTLNTAIIQAGCYYSNGHPHGKLAFNYQGLFPVFDLVVDYGSPAFNMTWGIDPQGNEITRGHYTDRTLLEAEARIYLPFHLNRGERIRGIQPALTYYFTNNQYQQYHSRTYRNFQYLLPEVQLYNYRRKALRDILPRNGYQLRLQWLTSPFNTENYGSLTAARLTTYFPGLVRNHALMLRLGYQYQALDGKSLYLPQRIVDKTRGYNYLYQTRQQWAAKADYAFPLFLPDWSLGTFAYIRRLRANIFCDYTRNQASRHSGWSTQSSLGTDLTFDWNVFRMNYPLTTGVRLIQPLDYGKFQAEMLFSVTF
ncbi:MAG: hypothetical protein RR331_01345 [Bacteroides sp.]